MTHIAVDFSDGVVAVLVDEALSLFLELINVDLRPPLLHVTVLIEQPT